jgi:formate dehydrogenase-N alpha subunit
MTNHWTDIANADVVLIIGSNAAENHPISFKWITEAQLRGAKVIHVDPRFTRTSAKADIWAPIRSGTDIAFIGGMINWVLEDMEVNPENYNMVYVNNYTNAQLVINNGIQLPEDLDGVFSGLNETARSYDKTTWKYANTTDPVADLNSDYSVFKLLKRHYSRYDADTVSSITGMPKDRFLEICQTYAASGQKGKSGTIMYAMGTTQHTYGTQNIRSYAILQLLLANIGVAGGGINALSGESNVQGSTDMCLLWHILPGYLAVPDHLDVDLDTYVTNHEPDTITPKGLEGDKSSNWWNHYKVYIASLVAAWYGVLSAPDPALMDTRFNYLPKVKKGENYSHMRLFEKMNDGVIKGLMCWGQNPAVGGPMADFERKALEKLDWLVCVDLWETETAAFWKTENPSRSKATGEIGTEVWMLPACASYEKEGTITNSGRWAQYRYKAVDAPGEAEDDLWIADKLVLKLKELYKADLDAPNRDAIIKLSWTHGADVDKVNREINGLDSNGKLVANFTQLNDDGTTSSGNWLYCDMYTEEEGNRAKSRDPVDHHPNQIGIYSNWAWCWPLNRRIIYNRASVDLDGKPWDAEHPVIEWKGPSKWVGDVPDGGWDPISLAPDKSKYLPFIMKPEGVARIWGYDRADGPLPEVYEPWESPLDANPMSGVAKGQPGFNDPTCFLGEDRGDPGSPTSYPYIAMTYRVTEEWQAGQMTRNLPWLVELMPEMFVEIGKEVAEDKGIANGDKVKVKSKRGEITAVAIVTPRLQPLTVGGKTLHHVGIPWHWGYTGLSTGASANMLTPHVGDANTAIPEFKTFLCNVEKA